MPEELPEWLKLIPDEALRAKIFEQAKNEWMPKADYTKESQAKAEEIKQLRLKAAEHERFTQWYQQEYMPWAAQIKPILESYRPATGAVAANQPSPAQNGSWYQNWDLLSAEEQAQRLQAETSRAIGQQLAAWSQQFQSNLQQLLAERERYYQDYLSLYVDANEKKRQDPELDIANYMKRALELRTGKVNPLETAYTLETLERDKQKWLEEGRKHGKQEAETEYRAKKPEPHSFLPGPEPFKPEKSNLSDRMGELKQKVAEKFPNAF